MTVHRLEVVAGDPAGGAEPCLPGIVALDGLEGREDHAWHWVARSG
jgi:hypothetical protein